MTSLSTLPSRILHILGKALRETGQALDRVGIRGVVHANNFRRLGHDKYIFQDHLSRHRNIMPLLRSGLPYINSSITYISPCSSIIGMVYIGARSSIWYGSIIRADRCDIPEKLIANSQEKLKWIYNTRKYVQDFNNNLKKTGGIVFIGNDTTIRDGCVISSENDHAIIGNGVTVGHMVNINSSIIEDNCVIGMGSILCKGSRIGKLSILEPGTVIGTGVIVGSREIWCGNPGKKVRNLTDLEMGKILSQIQENNSLANTHRSVMNLGGNISNNFLDDFFTNKN